jgi:hypothetical protein
MTPIPHPLEQKIIALRRRAWRMAAVHGLSLAAAIVLGVMAALGLVDYLFRFQDRGLRIIASLAAIGTCGWTFYRCILRLFLTHIEDVELALRLERRFPSLGDRLASAIEFLHASKDDPAAGSTSLREAVIAQTVAETKRLDFSAILDRRPVIRAATILVAACLSIGILTAIDPLAVQIAVTRLFKPLGGAVWPRLNHLTLRTPVDRVARGGDFQIEVVDALGARLPSDVRIHYRFTGADGVAVEETESMRPVDGTTIARRENVLRPFSYRVEGGDDPSMPWHDVEVVEPPAVASLSIRLTPPAYTGWPPSTSERHIRALTGTTVQIAGRVTKPLRSVTLCINGGTRITGKLTADGHDFAVEFPVEKSGAYWFELTDREGLVGGTDDRWEIHALPDAPPTATIEQPAANLFVTSAAIVPLRVAAKDDLGIARIAIEFAFSASSAQENNREGGQISLWTPPAGPRPLPRRDGASSDDRRTIDYRWDLAALNLTPGMQLTFYATVDDARPQTGRSEPRSLSIITAEELQDRIAGREKLIAAELERALRTQRSCRAQVDSIADALKRSPQIGQAEVDQIQSVAHNQRDVDQVLTSPGEGLPMHVRALLADLEINRIQHSDLARRASALLAEIDRLDREHLPAIGRELTAATKTAQVNLEENAPRANGIAASLATAAKHQDAVIASLVDLIGRQSRWDNYRRFAREIGQLVREQEDVTRRTADVGRRTLTQELRDLSPKDIADLNAPASRQLELARQLDRLLQEMDQAGEELRQKDPSAARTVADALEQARRSAISGQMRTAGQQIERNQIGRAAAGQKQIGRDLKAVLGVLAARQDDQSRDSTAKQPPETSQTPDAAQQPKPGADQRQGQGEKQTTPNMPGTAGDERARKPTAEELRAMIKQFWGELPDAARQQMLQSAVEEFPPKYQTLIEDYYRRLAEEKGGGKP